MNIRHKIIRFLEQPSGIIDLALGISPSHSHYFLVVKKFTNIINTYIDIGASKGKVIKAGKRIFPNAKMYAIEPIKEHCDKIRRLYPDVEVYNIGLWDEDTKKTFWFVKNRDVESSFLKPIQQNEENLETREMELKRFDSLPIKIKRPCFVKIDAEGSEERVLKGFGDRLNEVDFMQLEQTHSYKNEEKGMMSICIGILENCGFSGFIQVNTTYQPNGFPDKSDLIFFRDTRKNL